MVIIIPPLLREHSVDIGILVVLEIILSFPIGAPANDFTNVVVLYAPVELFADGESFVLELIGGLLGLEGGVEPQRVGIPN